MLPWHKLDTAIITEGGTLQLLQRGTEFSIMLGGNELMNSRRSGSETALATLTCDRLRACDAPSVLIGGLGMGFTLRAALAALGPKARVAVAELVPAVIAWATGPLASLHGDSLGDPRVTVLEADVGARIAAATDTYDAILLDVDNGPGGLSRAANDALYNSAGLRRGYRALVPGGILAIWSAHPDARFVERLRACDFLVEERAIHAHGKRGGQHTIWLAQRPGSMTAPTGLSPRSERSLAQRR
jgi:spermidine synthase